MTTKDFKKGGFYKTSQGRIGQEHCTSKWNLECGTVNLAFDGAGCVFAGEDFAPPSGMFQIESLTPVKKPKKI